MKRHLGVFFGAILMAALPTLAAAELYLAPNGNDEADGTREHPLATLMEATKRLPEGGSIFLLGGTYRETMTVKGGEEKTALTISAVDGQKVIFDGATAIGEWRKEAEALYSAPLPEGVGKMAQAYLHLWDRKHRVRLIRAMDEAGVKAWPNTFVLTGGGRLLVHLPAAAPEPTDLECNRVDKGLVILRPNVTVRGIAFQNFFQHQYSAAVSVGKVSNVEVADCRMENVSKAVSIVPGARDVRVLRCEIRDAGTAIASSGDHTTVEDCVIGAAQGDFVIHDLPTILRCGIRIYHPAVAATVRRNITAGFVYGLRIKSREYEEDQEWPPYVIEQNTFTDGISITMPVLRWFSEGSRLAQNIIGVEPEGEALLERLEKVSMTVKDNFIYRRTVEGDTSLPANPFRDSARGDLRIKEGVTLPEGCIAPARELAWLSTQGASAAPQVQQKYRPFQRSGRSATLHVRAAADATEADGSESNPYPELQPALDQAEPGDTVLIGAGVYTSQAVLTRSGTEAAPITLKGASAESVMMDGGRRHPVLLAIRDARHVKVEGITFRWFVEAGLEVIRSPHVTVESCRFFNAELTSRGVSIGFGIFAEKSPHLAVSRCVLARNRVGMKLVDSPDAVIRKNTGFKNLNTAVEMVRSCYRSSLTHNSFGYSSHASIYLWEPDLMALESLECDYNNYATRLYHYRQYTEGAEGPKEVLAVPARYGEIAGGKAVVDVLNSALDDRPRARYHDLASWREAHGKDAHSVFADPEYRAPQEGDFRLLPHSPNRLEGGEWIGACQPM